MRDTRRVETHATADRERLAGHLEQPPQRVRHDGAIGIGQQFAHLLRCAARQVDPERCAVATKQSPTWPVKVMDTLPGPCGRKRPRDAAVLPITLFVTFSPKLPSSIMRHALAFATRP